MKQYWGIFLLLAAQLGFSGVVVIGKYTNIEVPMYIYVASRFLVCTVFLAIINAARGTPLRNAEVVQGPLQRRDWGLIIGLSLTAGLFFNTLFFAGLRHTTATSAGIIASLLPGLVAVMALVFLRERLSRRKLVALAIAMFGVLVLNFDNLEFSEIHGSWLGDGLIILSMLPEAYYSILTKKLGARVNAAPAAMVVNLFSFILILPFAAQQWGEFNYGDLSAFMWFLLLFAGLLHANFYICWQKGMEIVPANTAAVFTGVMPIGTALMAIACLGEPFTFASAIGLVCVVLSIWLGTKA